MFRKIFKLIFKKEPSPWQMRLMIFIIVIIILLIGGTQIGAIKNYINFRQTIGQGELAPEEEKMDQLAEKKVETVIPGSGKTGNEDRLIDEDTAGPETASRTAQFISPLSHPAERIRLKKFGDYITPENSPVAPERFRGYHTGVDFEIYPEELNSAVEVRAACRGKILEKKWVSGYGGVVVTACEIDDQAVTALYGHLNIASISAKSGDMLEAGESIGNLGAEYSQETDGERKHLHLSLHKGKTINLRGYAGTEAELIDWLDPCEYICK